MTLILHTGTVAHTLFKELVAELVVEASPARSVSALITGVTGAYTITLSDNSVITNEASEVF